MAKARQKAKTAVEFDPIYGAKGFQLSNPDVFSATSLLASLRVFSITNMVEIREKSAIMTSYLRALLKIMTTAENVRFITPKDVEASGAQLSILISGGKVCEIVEECKSHGIILDKREPDLIRLALVGLYNTFKEVYQAAGCIARILNARLS